MTSSADRVTLTGWTLDGQAVQVPGTVTQVAREDLDARTWVFRTVLDVVPAAGERVLLHVDGVATVHEVAIDDLVVAAGESMFERHVVDVTALLHPGAVLEVRSLPLVPSALRRGRRRARWRTRLVDDGDLRFVRTVLLGRMPGVAPGPPVVGPWRPVWLERVRGEVPVAVLSARVAGADGHLRVTVDAVGEVESAAVTGALVDGVAELVVQDVALWWPHTHGSPVLHDVWLVSDGGRRHLGRVGFRSLERVGDDGLRLLVNGVPVFLRGAVWTPPGLLAGVPEDPRPTVALAAEAGANLLRVPGTATWETPAFHDACDELGVLVWQDLPLANLDVPLDDPACAELLLEEVRTFAADHAWRPSTAVVCGGSETAQQVAMLGLDPDLWRSPVLDVEVPALLPGVVWVPNSPYGGDLPMRASAGVAHWFGVGGYRRPLSDARTSGVRFASECLALAQATDDGDDGWVPRDEGSDWDFADVAEHYRALLFGGPADPEQARVVPGLLLEAVYGEWRRAASACDGGLVLWLRDLRPGSGWGLLDAAGRRKAGWWAARRAWAPQAVWLVDEGLSGTDVHVANDRGEPLAAELRVATYRDGGVPVDEVVRPVEVAAHGAMQVGVEELLGRFVDVSWAYRFGPPQQDVVVASLEVAGQVLSQAVHFPRVGPGPSPYALEVVREGTDLLLRCAHVLDGVRVRGGQPSDDGFCLEPGRWRRVHLGAPDDAVTVTALNLP